MGQSRKLLDQCSGTSWFLFTGLKWWTTELKHIHDFVRAMRQLNPILLPILELIQLTLILIFYMTIPFSLNKTTDFRFDISGFHRSVYFSVVVDSKGLLFEDVPCVQPLLFQQFCLKISAFYFMRFQSIPNKFRKL
jgi:hypothetical protein